MRREADTTIGCSDENGMLTQLAHGLDLVLEKGKEGTRSEIEREIKPDQ